MANFDNLPVYRTSYDLLVEIFRFAKEFTKEYKYTIGESLKKEVIEMITNIYRANSDIQSRYQKISLARENIEVIRLFLRLLRDLRQVTIKKFTSLNAKIESVSKQLSAWQKSAKN